MSATTSIQWTDRTWNPVRGCSVVSPGCHNCYAMKQAHRFSGKGGAYEGLTKQTRSGPQWTGVVRLVEDALGEPLRWRKPQRIFVNSMSDLFHESLTDHEITRVFGVMARSTRHTFQVLTKRPARMREWFAAKARSADRPLVWPDTWPLDNVWLGVSVEDQARADERIPLLLDTPAAVRFLSCEPLLGPLDLGQWIERIDHCNGCGGEHPPQDEDVCPTCPSGGPGLISTRGWAQAERFRTRERYDAGSAAGRADLAGTTPMLDWVIVGGESGRGARPFDLVWARRLRDECAHAGVAYFLKQLGALPHTACVPCGGAGRIGDNWCDCGGDGFDWPKLLDRKGGDMSEWPDDLRVRQFPRVAAEVAS